MATFQYCQWPVAGAAGSALNPQPVINAPATSLSVVFGANTNGNTTGSLIIGSGAATPFAPPSNAVGFVVEASSSNTANLRWSIGSVATATHGMRLEAGRDSGYIPAATTISVIAETGAAQEVQITWVLSS